ncbi:MAG TPA: M23 family metallopeptidase, partial [Saprospiraceae bacterium]|nr:M23 family metallopeptidase [Saprospiraceae bacterium]
MMKYKYVIVLLLLSCQVFGQYLNNTGHFISDATKRVECKVNLTVNGSEIEYKDLKLKGNSLYETPSGIITLSGDDESVSSKIRLYTLDGEEIFNKTFKDIINFSLSSNKHFAAFHNGQQIELFDIANRTFKSINGSNVFSVNDQGQLAWFDEDNSTINFDNQSMKISEPVYKILFFNNRPLFISKSSILVIEDNISRTIYSAQEGRFFDAAVFKDKLYISIKKELAKEFLFTSLSSSDLKNFNNEEETHFPLASAAQKIKQHSQLNTREDLPKGELIRTPLNYYSDSVYQPVGNSYDEMQDYGDPYLHPGVDLLGNYLQEVYSVKKGYVKSILTTGGYPYWRIAISNRDISEDSQGYLYAHLEETSFPYAVGDSVNEGDVIGQLVNFPVQGFVHCHFARITDKGITWKGDWWTFDNPLSYMSTLIDKIPPTFEKAKGNDEFA